MKKFYLLKKIFLVALINCSVNFIANAIDYDSSYIMSFLDMDTCINEKNTDIILERINLGETHVFIYKTNPDIGTNEPGEYDKLKINDNFAIGYAYWDKIGKSHNKGITQINKYNELQSKYLLKLNLGEDIPILILFGYAYPSDSASLLTIVYLADGNKKSELLFNKYCEILDIVENEDSYKLRARMGRYEYAGPLIVNEKGCLIPYDPFGNELYDIYITNNTLVVENLKLEPYEILDILNGDDPNQPLDTKEYVKIFETKLSNNAKVELFNLLGHENKYKKDNSILADPKEPKENYYSKIRITNPNGTQSEFTATYPWIIADPKFTKFSNFENPYFLSLDLAPSYPVIILFYPWKTREGKYHASDIVIVSLARKKPQVIYCQCGSLIQILENNGAYTLRISDDLNCVLKYNEQTYTEKKLVSCKDIYLKNNKIQIDEIKLPLEEVEKIIKSGEESRAHKIYKKAIQKTKNFIEKVFSKNSQSARSNPPTTPNPAIAK